MERAFCKYPNYKAKRRKQDYCIQWCKQCGVGAPRRVVYQFLKGVLEKTSLRSESGQQEDLGGLRQGRGLPHAEGASLMNGTATGRLCWAIDMESPLWLVCKRKPKQGAGA